MTLLLFLYSILMFSQDKTSRVEYSLIVGEDSKFDNSPVAEYYKEARKNAKYVTFFLDFNDTAMLFYENKKMNSGENNTNFSSAFSGVDGKYYKEKKSNIIFNEIDNHIGHIILKKIDDTKWVLTKESKKIQGYLCYKATTVSTVKNSAGTFKRTIIAWYCPMIPASFGPKGYGGLPGLILELQDRNIIIGATKIELKTKDAKIEIPKNGKLVTEEEYKKLITDFAKKIEDESK
ncbi:GLPGLI family protein [Flavobacterium sp.]|uniref:GLPGLI family protein n=1 Tax=Flavobacterium sp. TaxID=239 RepID=UPI00260615C4|nr:GLPGLI family protein [Flavobacterium sp.]